MPTKGALLEPLGRDRLTMQTILFRRLLRAFFWAATPLLLPFERVALRRASAKSGREVNPVFIIGVPRSGSTLLYKIIAEVFDFAFFNNLSSWFFKTPYIGMLVSRLIGAKPSVGLESHYGVFSGMGDPHEFGSYWYRWFSSGLNVYTPAGALTQSAKDEIRNEVFAISALCGRPLLFKNLFNSMRIAALAECFPEATFIVCRRDPLQNALSLLKGRIENARATTEWWTVPPKEVRRLLGRPPAEQVAGQVYYVNEQIEADMRSVGRERFFIVEYEEFCRDVHGTLRDAAAFFQRHGYSLPRVNLAAVPPFFECRNVTGLRRSDEIAVASALATFQGA